jgi:hypothetical protein
VPIRGPAALQRKDIRLKVGQHNPRPANTNAKTGTTTARQPIQGESPQFYQQVGQRIGQYYAQQTQPETEASMSAWI